MDPTKLELPVVSSLRQASSFVLLLIMLIFRRSEIRSSLYGSYKSFASLWYQVLGQASSLRALVNNINFIGGARSGAHGMDPTKAPPPCGSKFGAGILLSLRSYKQY
jgi:hypothetical protein